MSDTEFITARQERYRVAHNSLDPDKLLALMTEDVDYSDHGLGVAHINGAELRALAEAVFSSVKEMVFSTVSLNGDKEFTAWEWTAKGTILKEMPGVPYKVGQEFEALGCSLFWWDVESGGDKIKRMAEYSKFL